MSAISQKSISGITSITTPAGVDNVFTVHTNDTTERFRVDSNGNQVISGIITASQFKLLDNAKAIYGNSGDMEIYHNATNSLIQNGTGSLQIITTTGDLFLRGQDNITFNTAGNNERLRITSGGTVAINDSSPNTYFKLDVNGHTNIVGDIALPTANRIYFGNSDTAFIKGEHGGSAYLAFGANNEKMRLTRSGRLGITTNNPSAPLHIVSDLNNIVQIQSTNRYSTMYMFDSIGSTFIQCDSGDLRYGVGGGAGVSGGETEALRIKSTGEVLINESSARSYVDGAGNTQTPKLQVESDDNTSAAISLRYNSGGGAANRRASFIFARTADGSAVSNNSVLGEVLFMGEGNNTLEKAASIRAEVDNTPGTNDMPGRLIFSTSADGSDSPTERVRITNTGQVGINTSSLTHLFEVHALGNDANNLQQISFEKKSSANNKQAFGLTIRSSAQTSSGNEPTAFLKFDARPSSLNGSHGGNAIIAFSPIGVTQGTYGKGNLDFYIRSGGPYTFQNDPGGAGEMQPKLRIDPEGRVMMGGATSAHGSTNRDDLVIGAVNQGNQTGITIGSATASGISFADAGNDTAGGIYYSHGNDDMIFYAGGNQRGKVKDDSGVTGIEHHRFIPFLIGYDVQNTTNITMSKGFGGMSQIAMNADGDKAYMSYVTHWRHRQYAGVYFWYGASGNTSGATFDWDFTVWNAGSGIGYSQSSHTFTITSGTMSNGKMYRLSALSSWPTHAAAKFVQFEIEFDELQNGTSLQLSGMELAEYTTP